MFVLAVVKTKEDIMRIALRAVVFVMVLVWGASQALADGSPLPPPVPNPKPQVPGPAAV
jgi:hypothetical protein